MDQEKWERNRANAESAGNRTTAAAESEAAPSAEYWRKIAEARARIEREAEEPERWDGMS
jgi:hypothetical protein